MFKFIFMRFFKAILTIWFILSLVFLFTRMTGDPTEWLLPDDASATQRAELRADLGLDEPLHKQYIDNIMSLFTGRAGKSYNYLRPVSDLFRERVGFTLRLGFVSFAIAVATGVIMGMIAAVYRNSFFDRLAMGLTIMGSTIPNFVLSILMIFLFSLKLRLLPSSGTGGPANYVMPMIAMCVGPMASIARITRSSLLDVLRQDYLDLARSKGVSTPIVMVKHALRNALIPVVTIIGLQLGTIIAGSVVVETVFSWPGVGTLIINAAKVRDYPIILYGVMWIAVTVTFMNMLVDVSYSLLDPRIRDNA